MSTSSRSLRETTSIPDFTPYLAKSPNTNRSLQYFMVGSMGLLAASGAKSTVSDILSNMAASADVLALAKVEVEMSAIPEGKNLIVKWRGKPVFIRHRTADEIQEANKVDVKTLRDPQKDDDRVQRPEWLVMLGVCTHLGCVPLGQAGDCESSVGVKTSTTRWLTSCVSLRSQTVVGSAPVTDLTTTFRAVSEKVPLP